MRLAHLAAGCGLAPGDLPQRQYPALVPALGDGQLDAGVGELVFAGPAVVAGPGGGGELFTGQVGDGLAGVVLAPGEQVEASVDDVGEQARRPAAPVEAQRRLPVFAGDAAQGGQQAADLAGQRG